MLTELPNLNPSFFQYIQTAYALICQSIFDFFKGYIKQRAQSRAATHAFSRRNLDCFAWSGKDEQNNPRLLESALKFQQDDEKLVLELWQEQVEKLRYFNLQSHDCTHLFKNMVHRFKEQIKTQELPLHIVFDMDGLPLPFLFWNQNNAKFWHYCLRLKDFTPKAGFVEDPYFQLRNYYEFQQEIHPSDTYSLDEES